MHTIQFGVHMPPAGVKFDTVKTTVTAAEQLGFDLFTMTDHLYPMGFDPHPDYPLECWTVLAAAAAVTNKIKIGPLVTCGLYRNLDMLAKIATTVDIISNGRLVFGIGAGDMKVNLKFSWGVFLR